jgi:hypothetical protein
LFDVNVDEGMGDIERGRGWKRMKEEEEEEEEEEELEEGEVVFKARPDTSSSFVAKGRNSLLLWQKSDHCRRCLLPLQPV